ncbi:ZZ-type zinc finger-containing protein 3 [Halyomorpha halys]|uniref:ZZ-type zinc finger-containing protein 3 n=1 Tax=Halyomorpha halys TaxID=286706 RepID=UPI0006D4DD25|nr:ZZ-type zinc finger-containing protein 3 [Halyomorpha halys]XP_024216060.1 ZZ-type zinc finger-containing protein 3 [Halyomorpha halys]
MAERTDGVNDFLSNFSKTDHNTCKDESLFYFETDYLPLKGNADYLKLMKSLAILEAQRISVCKDIHGLEELKSRSVEEPVLVKQQILEGKLTCLNRCKVEKVPEIDFSKYKCLSLINNKQNQLFTRRMAKNQVSVKEDSSGSEIRVRGRVYNENKPRTFNQLWTVEEQLRLEQLLVEYPPEPIESRRFEKIAKALGNRTPQQVCSRVQKYYKKLAKAGIRNKEVRKTSRKKTDALNVHKRHKHYLYRPSTFFPGMAMGEMGETDSEEQSDEDSTDLSHWAEIHKKLREEKNMDELRIEHIGYKCYHCRQQPIVGFRWECKSCPKISFCSSCISQLCKMDPPPHPITHRYRPYDMATNSAYSIEAFSSDNYLDPNFSI